MSIYKKYIWTGPKSQVARCSEEPRCKENYKLICPGRVADNRCIFAGDAIRKDRFYLADKIIFIEVEE
jgi:hypothetical protein